MQLWDRGGFFVYCIVFARINNLRMAYVGCWFVIHTTVHIDFIFCYATQVDRDI